MNCLVNLFLKKINLKLLSALLKMIKYLSIENYLISLILKPTIIIKIHLIHL